MSMEEELRQKIYEMHGTVQRLDGKLDAVDKKLSRLDNDIESVEEQVDKVDSKAQSNRRKLAVIGGTATLMSTVAIIASQLAGGVFA